MFHIISNVRCRETWRKKLCIRNSSQMLNKGKNAPVFLRYSYTSQLVIYCFTLCVCVCVYIYIYIRPKIFPQIIIKNNNFKDARRYGQSNFQYNHSQITTFTNNNALNICAIFKPCLSGTTAVSDPGVRQVWPSAHCAAGY
jgi:hypothetical protein